MKTIITATDNNLDAKFDLRFGRAGWFCVYDRDTKTTNFVPNGFKESNAGAGTKSSEMAAELGVSQIISGHFGPKAKDMLTKLKIQMIELQEDEIHVADVIAKLEKN